MYIILCRVQHLHLLAFHLLGFYFATICIFFHYQVVHDNLFSLNAWVPILISNVSAKVNSFLYLDYYIYFEQFSHAFSLIFLKR